MERLYITRDGFVMPFRLLLNTTDSEIPFMPEVVEEVDELPGRDGEVQVSQRYAAANHILVLRSWPDITEAEKDALKLQVREFVAAARREPVELHYERYGLSYFVRYVGLPEKVQEYAGWVEFRLPFKAHDPLGYEGFERKRTEPGQLDNKGTELAPVRFVVASGVANPAFVIDGVHFGYAGTVPVGSTLVVETENRTARIVGAGGAVTNANSGWSGGFLMLTPGTHRLTAAPKGGSVIWRCRWA